MGCNRLEDSITPHRGSKSYEGNSLNIDIIQQQMGVEYRLHGLCIGLHYPLQNRWGQQFKERVYFVDILVPHFVHIFSLSLELRERVFSFWHSSREQLLRSVVLLARVTTMFPAFSVHTNTVALWSELGDRMNATTK